MRLKSILLIVTSLVVITGLSYLQSCTHKPASLDDIPEVCFEGQVLPIFLNSCALAGCHDGNGEDEYVFTTYEGILKEVERGNAEASKVYRVLTNIWSVEGMMPPDQPLSLENRTLIRLWIDQGANYTVCPEITNPGGIDPGSTDPYINPRACFDRDIMPVVLSSCAVTGCHDDITAQEDYRLTSYNGVLEIVSAGSPLTSKLYKVITLTDPNDVMPPPPYDRLSSAQIDSIYAWISYGATDEYCGEPCDTLSTITYSGFISPVIVNSCRGCHSGTSPSGSVRLESYTDVAAVAASGQLMGVLKGAGYAIMPPSGTFSVCRIRQFELWVENGYLNN